MRSRPWRAARSSARSWTRNRSGCVRLRRRPRSPCRLAARIVGLPAGARGSRRQARRELVLVDVEGPHRHDAGRHALEHAAIDLVLAVFVADVLDAAGHQELGPVEADPFGAGVARRGEVVGELDVRVEPDRHAVGGRGGPAPFGVDHRAGPMIVGVPRGAGQLLRCRVEDQLARGTVDDDELPGLDALARVVEADHRRDVEGARQDRGVVGPAAGIGGEAAHLGPVDLRRDRRRQLVGDQHRRLVELAQEIARRGDAFRAGSCAGDRPGRRRRPCAPAGTDRRLPRRRC